MASQGIPRDNLFAEIVRQPNLLTAWERVRDNRGCAGVDRVTVSHFERDLDGNLAQLAYELKTGSYCPLPLMRVLVDKGGGEARTLSIPAIRHRLAQAAALNVLEPIFEAEFEHCSFA